MMVPTINPKYAQPQTYSPGERPQEKYTWKIDLRGRVSQCLPVAPDAPIEQKPERPDWSDRP